MRGRFQTLVVPVIGLEFRAYIGGFLAPDSQPDFGANYSRCLIAGRSAANRALVFDDRHAGAVSPDLLRVITYAQSNVRSGFNFFSDVTKFM